MSLRNVHAIMLHISALALHSNRARAQLNRALAQHFQMSQGRLNEARPSAARSDHTSQMNTGVFGGQTHTGTVKNA